MEVIIHAIMKLLPVTFYLNGALTLRGLLDNQEKISSPQISSVLWMLKLPDCGIWKVRYGQHLDDLFLCFHSEPIHGFKYCLGYFSPNVGLCWPWCSDWAPAAWETVQNPYWRHFLKEAKKIECTAVTKPLLEMDPDHLWEIPVWLTEFPWAKIPFQERLLNSSTVLECCVKLFFFNNIFLKFMQKCLSELGPEEQDKQWVKHTNG